MGGQGGGAPTLGKNSQIIPYFFFDLALYLYLSEERKTVPRDNVRSKHFQEPLLNTVSQPRALWNNLDDEDGDDDEDQDEED